VCTGNRKHAAPRDAADLQCVYRVLGGWRGRKRRSAAAAAGDDTEGSSGKITERAGGGGSKRGRGVRGPRGATQAGRGVIQEITTDALVEAAAEATGAVAALAMMSVRLWQHGVPIDDEGGDDNVGTVVSGANFESRPRHQAKKNRRTTPSATTLLRQKAAGFLTRRSVKP